MKRLLLLIFSFVICYEVDSHVAVEVLADANTSAPMLEVYAKNIINFNREYPQEKVYLHMDNRSYFIGDTIFFKAYVMNATTLHPTTMSGVLYVELLNEAGIEMEHKKLKIEGGVSKGSFILKGNYRTGYYEIRAYTRYMLNFGSEPKPWINIHNYLKDVNINPYAISPELRARSNNSTLKNVYATPIWQQSIVADANHCQFSRVFPVYMYPETEGVYKREMDWYPPHTQLAYPEETEEELRDDSLRLTFYPEGGNMVAGVASCLAVEANDQWGREKSISGYITEGRNGKDTLSVFRTRQRGRGLFSIIPEKGKKYFACITYKGKDYRYALPEIENSGCVLHVSAPIGHDELSFTINASEDRNELIGYTLQCRGAVTAFDTLRITGSAMHTITIPHVQLMPGVNQLTLYNARGEILAERLFFVSPPKEQPSLSILTQIPDTLSPFEKVTLDIKAMASNGYFTQAHFSLAITDADESDATFDTGDIRSEMLLSSDLKGFIKDVDSYFHHANDTAMRDDIDLLMMVQGWRRYEWRAMAGVDPYTLSYKPESRLQLDGYVITDDAPSAKFADASSYKRLGNLAVHVTMKDPLITVNDTCYADSTGVYHMAFKKDFFGEVPMSIVLSEVKDGTNAKRGSIINRLKYAYPIIQRVFSPSTTPYNYYQCHTPEEDAIRTVTNAYDWQMEGNIENVDVTKRHKQSSELYLDRPEIVVDYYKEWNYTIDRGIPNANIYEQKQYYANDRELSPKEAALEGEDSGIQPTNDNNEIQFNYTLGRSRLWGRIARLEDSVFTYDRKSRYRAYLMPKHINVYTNLVSREAMSTPIDPNTDTRPYVVWKPDYHRKSMSPRTAPYMLKDGVRNTFFEGYSRVVSYYHRDYSDDELPDSTDYRRTLYWNPSITTNPIGKAQVTFYNNARTKHIHVRAEGFTRNGEFIVYDSEKE